MGAVGSVAEPPGRPGLAIGHGKGCRETGGLALDQDGIAPGRLADHGDEGLKDDAARGQRARFGHGGFL